MPFPLSSFGIITFIENLPQAENPLTPRATPAEVTFSRARDTWQFPSSWIKSYLSLTESWFLHLENDDTVL